MDYLYRYRAQKCSFPYTKFKKLTINTGIFRRFRLKVFAPETQNDRPIVYWLIIYFSWMLNRYIDHPLNLFCSFGVDLEKILSKKSALIGLKQSISVPASRQWQPCSAFGSI